MQGYKEILARWFVEAKGAKFSLKIYTDLKNRGVKDKWRDKYSNCNKFLS